MEGGGAGARAGRRAAATLGHLRPGAEAEGCVLARGAGGTAGRGGVGKGGGAHASATGVPSSYEQRHGAVSRAPAAWAVVELLVDGRPLSDTRYEKCAEGIARLTICRPEVRNAFRPRTLRELARCMEDARDDPEVGVVVLRGEGDLAFCSGGDQSVRGSHGYVGADGVPRLSVLDLQVQMRRMPKPVVASVAGYAVGGGHILHMVCDLTIAADNAVFGQTGPKVGSFDAGYGSSQMSRLVGPKRAREMWFLCRLYSAQQAMEMGLVNTVVPLRDLEEETLVWCREMLRNSPTALRVIKASMNAVDDGHAGLQVPLPAPPRPVPPGPFPPSPTRPTPAARSHGRFSSPWVTISTVWTCARP